ncbi:MAG: hypothetical protein JO189_11615 [Deltaproteobacteria bacterium]|nr:hypothetical protein [Deltaproteobacteria bacterium]
MAAGMGDGLEVWLFVEGGIVEEESEVGPQFLAQHVRHPVIDQPGIGSAGAQHGSSHNDGRPWIQSPIHRYQRCSLNHVRQ